MANIGALMLTSSLDARTTRAAKVIATAIGACALVKITATSILAMSWSQTFVKKTFNAWVNASAGETNAKANLTASIRAM